MHDTHTAQNSFSPTEPFVPDPDPRKTAKPNFVAANAYVQGW